MLVQLHLREYDDADIITFMHGKDRGTKSRTVRKALRLLMADEATHSADDDSIESESTGVVVSV